MHSLSGMVLLYLTIPFSYTSLLSVFTWDNLCIAIIIFVDVLHPTNVRAVVLTSRSIHITWDPSSSSDVTGYLISYTTTASYTSGGSVTVNGGSITSGTLTNLEEDTLYTITVQATTSDNRLSANSNEVSVRTYTDGK